MNVFWQYDVLSKTFLNYNINNQIQFSKISLKISFIEKTINNELENLKKILKTY